MSIKFNAEGYRDNTANAALYNVSQHHIHFAYGVMDINLSSFFPCLPHEAKALLGLVESYCSLEDKTQLLAFLNAKAQQMQERIIRLESLDDRSDYLKREMAELKRLYRLLKHNISLFETMEVRS